MRIGVGLGMDADAGAAAVAAVRQARAVVPEPQLAIAYGSIYLDQKKVHQALCRELDPRILLGGSSYAEVTNRGVSRGSVAVLLLSFDGGRVHLSGTDEGLEPYELGRALARTAPPPLGPEDLRLALLSIGIATFWEDRIAEALYDRLGRVPVFGGRTCGDYDLGFSHPEFWTNFQYSERLTRAAGRMAFLQLPRPEHQVAFAFEHGWQPIGPLQTLTRCDGNKVYEIDGRPILDFYREFLGREESADFFESMVQRYGFSLQLGEHAGSLVKAPVAWDARSGFVAFAPASDLQGRRVRLIQANRKGIVDGARDAALRCRRALGDAKPALLLMISCCTRAAILNSRVSLELDAVRRVFGADVPVFGYYAGGEFAPSQDRYDDILDPGRTPARSFYHATTLCLMALGCARPAVVALPPEVDAAQAAGKDAELARLADLLARSEKTQDDSEAFLTNMSRKAYKDGEQLRKQTEVIHRYTPHEVWREVGATVARGEYELEETEVLRAFMFMDVKGFTSFSERHGASEVVRALNDIFDPATGIIYDCGGDVDKYIGDCIFASFPEGARAVEAGRRILGLLEGLAAGGNPFSVRIGINWGRAVRANVGARDRREYTFIGDAVNLAQRLESNCTPGRLLLCEALQPESSVFRSVERREISVKGKSAPVVAFECAP